MGRDTPTWGTVRSGTTHQREFGLPNDRFEVLFCQDDDVIIRDIRIFVVRGDRAVAGEGDRHEQDAHEQGEKVELGHI